MNLLELNHTKFKSTKHCFNPDEGKTIILPTGFGFDEKINIKTISKEEVLKTIKCPIFTCMVKDQDEYNMFTSKNKIDLTYFKIYEKYLFFISNIYKSYLYKLNTINNREMMADTSYKGMGDNTENIEIPTIFFSMSSDSKTGLIANSLGMSKDSVSRMVKFMIDYKFIELYSEQHSFINYDKGETIADLKCRHFIVSEQFYRSPTKYFVRNQYITDHIQKQYTKTIDELVGSESASFEKELISDSMITSYTFPTVERLMEIADKMVVNGEKDKFGRIYNYGIPKEWLSEENGTIVTKKKANGESFSYTVRGKLKPNCPYVDINVHIYNYVLMMNGPKVVKKRKIYRDKENLYNDRFYYFLAMIPKWIRNEIKIDDENIKEVDATALHPRIVGKLFETHTNEERPNFLEGDSHTKIADMLGIERNQAKIISLSYWNSKIVNNKTVCSKKNEELFGKMDEFIIKNYPKLFEFLVDVKCNMKAIKKGKSRHTNMSVMLMHEETQIISNFFWNLKYTLKDFSITTLYCYDSISVKKSKYDSVKQIFEETVDLYLN